MQQSSVSISLSFLEPRYQSSRRLRASPSQLHKQINPHNQRDKGLSIPTRSLTRVRYDRYDKIRFLVFFMIKMQSKEKQNKNGARNSLLSGD